RRWSTTRPSITTAMATAPIETICPVALAISNTTFRLPECDRKQPTYGWMEAMKGTKAGREPAKVRWYHSARRITDSSRNRMSNRRHPDTPDAAGGFRADDEEILVGRDAAIRARRTKPRAKAPVMDVNHGIGGRTGERSKGGARPKTSAFMWVH